MLQDLQKEPESYVREQLPDGYTIVAIPEDLRIFSSNAFAQVDPNHLHPWELDPRFGENGHHLNTDLDIEHSLGLQGKRFDFFPISYCASVDDQGNLIIDKERVDSLIEKLIIPLKQREMTTLMTLFHWEYLDIEGGWTNPKMPALFVEYIKQLLPYICEKTESDLHEIVPSIILANEPLVYLGNIHLAREFPPYGDKEIHKYKTACANLASALQEVREFIKREYPEVKMGISNNYANYEEVRTGNRIKDWITRRAAKTYRWHDQKMFEWLMRLGKKLKRNVFHLFAEGVFLPDTEVSDVIMFNYWHNRQLRLIKFPEKENKTPYSQYGWDSDPLGLLRILLELHREYPGKEIIITELGAHLPDELDHLKEEYWARILLVIAAAKQHGVNISAIGVWGIIDNIEWEKEGPSNSGVIAVMGEGEDRVPRPSAAFLSNALKTRYLQLPEEWIVEVEKVIAEFHNQEG